jgi:hypothetical protein
VAYVDCQQIDINIQSGGVSMESLFDQPGFKVVLMTCFVVICLSPFILPLLLVVFTGRGAGFLKRHRQIRYEGVKPDEIWSLFIERLRHEKFVIMQAEQGRSIYATRDRNALRPDTPGNIYKHAGLPLKATVTIDPDGDNSVVVFILQYTALIVADTGEGKYLEQLIERLFCADLQNQNQPKVTNPNMMLSVAFMLSILMVIGGASALTPLLSAAQCLGLIVGYFVGIFTIIPLMAMGAIAVRNNPGEITGIRLIAPTLVMALAAILMVTGSAMTRHRQAFVAEWNMIQSKQREKQAEREGRHIEGDATPNGKTAP